MRITHLLGLLPSKLGLLGINARNVELIYTNNERKFFPNVDNKLRCKELLSAHGIPVPQTYHAVTGLESLRVWQKALEGVHSFVIKPNRGYGGSGILLVERKGELFQSGSTTLDVEDITFHVQQIFNGAFSRDNVSDTAYFEERIINHPGVDAFIADGVEGVTDVRIIFKGNRPLMAMMRVPTRESDGKANLHQGGLGVGIDLETGLSLNGCHYNKVITHHPETGNPLSGIPIPHFFEMIEYGAGISDIIKLGYIGVDFVCDARHGPLVLEVNARPGLNIQIANEEGLKKRLQ